MKIRYLCLVACLNCFHFCSATWSEAANDRNHRWKMALPSSPSSWRIWCDVLSSVRGLVVVRGLVAVRGLVVVGVRGLVVVGVRGLVVGVCRVGVFLPLGLFMLLLLLFAMVFSSCNFSISRATLSVVSTERFSSFSLHRLIIRRQMMLSPLQIIPSSSGPNSESSLIWWCSSDVGCVSFFRPIRSFVPEVLPLPFFL